MEKRDTREHILRIGMDLMARQGYGATGIGAILSRAEVPKGSFYHYFPSKEAFGLAIIDRFAHRYEEKLLAFLRDDKLAPLERIRAYLDAIAQRLDNGGCDRGCLAGNLGQELAACNQTFRRRLQHLFDSWQEHLANCLAAAQAHGHMSADISSSQLAGVVLNGLEGAILRAKVQCSAEPVREFIDVLFSRLLR
ncbi:transcriptional regulator, TetR family [Syntrophotalea carbinolica DSM 2380]|uniref:Transcriptional regulator, TetR family n=1 Tax=Syntrophotalea carbinolica (strain DSM 2380 / NBRC 103641 / GraBd1) TaxID=338963 RepID=Q3A7E8_SYNC1|nr:TetR/AcrR family transcriptional regulator [Syntrophotalea carbinolica]ABA87696.1 transcriptional regulator, TetR family [Syntrophotalea carbinolica DSM 2380]